MRERLTLRVVEDLGEVPDRRVERARGRATRSCATSSSAPCTRPAAPRSAPAGRRASSRCGTAGRLRGALPLYLKSHSYGEYVFDWAWADAYERHGLAYYPKLLCAVPFSPVSGARLLAADRAARDAARRRGARARARRVVAARAVPARGGGARARGRPGSCCAAACSSTGPTRATRTSRNSSPTLTHDKRKKIRQERRRVREAGVTFRRKVGARDHARGLALLHALLQPHLPRAPLHALPQPRILHAPRRDACLSTCC